MHLADCMTRLARPFKNPILSRDIPFLPSYSIAAPAKRIRQGQEDQQSSLECAIAPPPALQLSYTAMHSRDPDLHSL